MAESSPKVETVAESNSDGAKHEGQKGGCRANPNGECKGYHNPLEYLLNVQLQGVTRSLGNMDDRMSNIESNLTQLVNLAETRNRDNKDHYNWVERKWREENPDKADKRPRRVLTAEQKKVKSEAAKKYYALKKAKDSEKIKREAEEAAKIAAEQQGNGLGGAIPLMIKHKSGRPDLDDAATDTGGASSSNDTGTIAEPSRTIKKKPILRSCCSSDDDL
jgi:hypothetical protein